MNKLKAVRNIVASRKSSVTGKRKVDSVSEVPANLKPFMDRVMNDMKEIRK